MKRNLNIFRIIVLIPFLILACIFLNEVNLPILIIILVNGLCVLNLIRIVVTARSKANVIKRKTPEYTYYRDIIEYSPLIQARLIGKSLKDKDVITDMILYLKEENKAIEEGGMLVINEEIEMMEHEKNFIYNSKDIFTDLNNNKYTYLDALDNSVKDDMIKEGLIEPKNSNLEFGLRTDITILGYFLFNFLVTPLAFYFANGIQNMKVAYAIVSVYLISNLLCLIVCLIDMLFKITVKSNKTEKGFDIMLKIEAQKRFLKESTLISTREIKEIVLWKYYIRTAILHNLKGKLDKDATKYYKDVINKYYYDEAYVKQKIKDTLILVAGFTFFIIYSAILEFLCGAYGIAVLIGMELFSILYMAALFKYYEQGYKRYKC